MIKLIAVYEDGSKRELENVVDFDYVDRDFVESVASSLGVSVSDDDLEEIRLRAEYQSHIITEEDLIGIIKDIKRE